MKWLTAENQLTQLVATQSIISPLMLYSSAIWMTGQMPPARAAISCLESAYVGFVEQQVKRR